MHQKLLQKCHQKNCKKISGSLTDVHSGLFLCLLPWDKENIRLMTAVINNCTGVNISNNRKTRLFLLFCHAQPSFVKFFRKNVFVTFVKRSKTNKQCGTFEIFIRKSSPFGNYHPFFPTNFDCFFSFMVSLTITG